MVAPLAASTALFDEPTRPIEEMILAYAVATGRCPVNHEAAKYDDAAWSLLKFIGLQVDWDDDGKEAPLALCNCSCGTTLARQATGEDLLREQTRQLLMQVKHGKVTVEYRKAVGK